MFASSTTDRRENEQLLLPEAAVRHPALAAQVDRPHCGLNHDNQDEEKERRAFRHPRQVETADCERPVTGSQGRLSCWWQTRSTPRRRLSPPFSFGSARCSRSRRSQRPPSRKRGREAHGRGTHFAGWYGGDGLRKSAPASTGSAPQAAEDSVPLLRPRGETSAEVYNAARPRLGRRSGRQAAWCGIAGEGSWWASWRSRRYSATEVPSSPVFECRYAPGLRTPRGTRHALRRDHRWSSSM